MPVRAPAVLIEPLTAAFNRRRLGRSAQLTAPAAQASPIQPTTAKKTLNLFVPSPTSS